VVTPLPRWLRLLLVAVALVAVAGAAPPAAHAQKAFELVSLDTTAVVNPDASMDVTEVWVYRFDGGPFQFGIRSFETEIDSIRSFTAADDEGPLEVIAPGDSVSGDWEWALRQPTSDATVTYTLTYRVVPALRVGADVADLNWQFIGTEHDGIGRMTVDVRFPPGIPAWTEGVPDDDPSTLRGWGHGDRDGVVEVDDSRIVATVDGVDSGQFVEIRAAAPATAFTVTGAEVLLPDLLAEERDLADDVAEREDRRRLGFVITPVLAALGALGTGLLWFTGGRERPSREVQGDYWREPLDDKPAVALANLERGRIDAGPTIAGTLVDLAQRGYIRILGEREERIGRDKLVHRYLWLGKPLGPDVVEYERELLEMIFRGQSQATSEEVNDWAKDHQTQAKAQLDRITAAVTEEYEAKGYEQPMPARKVAILTVLCLVVGGGSWLVTSWADNGVGWVGVGAAVALFLAGTRLLKNRTQAGVEAAAKARGLQRFLRDFSRLEDAPIGHLILWERYLVYAVALGVSADLVRGMAARVPQVVNDPSFGVWYAGPGGRFDGFDRIEVHGGALATASTPKNTSGGGGGFSGGSSGGGGGGGAGAR